MVRICKQLSLPVNKLRSVWRDEGSSSGLVKVLSLYVPARAEENHEGPQDSRHPVRDSNRASPKDKSQILSLASAWLINTMSHIFSPHGPSDPDGSGPPHYRGFTITLGRTPQDKWPTGHRDLCPTIHNTHNRQTSMTRAGFERILPASEQPQTNALDRTVTGILRHTLELRNSMWFL